MKQNKGGIVVRLSESTDWEEEKPFPSWSASTLKVLSASEELVARSEWSKRSPGFLRKLYMAVCMPPAETQ